VKRTAEAANAGVIDENVTTCGGTGQRGGLLYRQTSSPALAAVRIGRTIARKAYADLMRLSVRMCSIDNVHRSPRA